MKKGILFFLLATTLTSLAKPAARKTLSLDGTWQIAEGSLTSVPGAFDRRVPVPGLVDMAQPPFVEPGSKVADREQGPQKDPRRDAFWYRRTFTMDGPVPPVATLKVAKAMFGTRVILNGQSLGDHAPSFTPGFFEAKVALKTGQNDLLIRIGADGCAVPGGVPSGRDGEKQRYIPGIFDSAALILSGTPAIENVQVAPDLMSRQARVRVWLKQATMAGEATVEVREAKSRKLARRTAARFGGVSGANARSHRAGIGLPYMVAGRSISLRDHRPHGWGRIHDAVWDARVQVRSRDGPGDVEWKAVFHARQQLHSLPLFRGPRSGQSAVERGLGAAASPAGEGHALELPALLHRVSAGGMVSHRRRGGHFDSGRISDLEHGPQAG